MNQNLLKNKYDPFKSPPDIQICLNHFKASKVSKTNPSYSGDFCECCSLPIDSLELPLNINTRELTFLGLAFSFYFDYLQYGGQIILVLFIILKLIPFEDISLISYKNSIISCLLLFYTIYIKQNIKNKLKTLRSSIVDVKLYTIMISNLSQNTTEMEIKEFFEKLTKYKVEKINMAYDINEYKENVKSKIKLIELKRQQEIQNINDQQIQQQIELLDQKQQNLESQYKNGEKLIGTAFVTFSNQQPVKTIIQEFGVSKLRNLQFFILGFILNPYLKIKNTVIFIQKPPDPTEIIWENLHISYFQIFLYYIFLQFTSVIVIFVSFYIQYSIAVQVHEHYTKQIASFVVLLSNIIFRQIITFYCKKMKFISTTHYNRSFIQLNIFFFFFNSAFVPYLVQSIQANQKQLITDIHMILFTNSFTFTFIKIFNFEHMRRIYLRTKILADKNSCYTQYSGQKIFQNPNPHIEEGYEFATKILLLSVWYASSAPFGLIFCLMGLMFSYIVFKFFLLRVNCYPQQLNIDLISQFIDNLEFLPYIFQFGAIEFSHRVVVSSNLIDYFEGFIIYGVGSITLTLFLSIYLIFYKEYEDLQQMSNMNYEQAKYLFTNEYDRVNPITSQNANIEWQTHLKNQDNYDPRFDSNSQNITNYFSYKKQSTRKPSMFRMQNV